MRKSPLLLSTLVLSVLASCSTGSESGVNGGQLFVRSCSLGCSDGSSGVQVSCQIQSTVQNAEISVLFSEAVDANSISATTFRVINVDNGTTPVGEYFVDPNDARRVIFRPALTFDSAGQPTFGFDIDTPYQITIPGELQGDVGPFVRSIVGRPNQSRMECTIVTSDDITDPVPGPPVVEVYADYVVLDGSGNVIGENLVANAFGSFDGFGSDGLEDNLVNGPNELTNVRRIGNVYMLFKDVMNPATLANPASMTAPFVNFRTDEDGDLGTTFDRSDPIPGAYQVEIDTQLLQTVLSFTPSTSFLSAGAGAVTGNPRRTVVDIPLSVVDLDNNSVTPQNGGGLSSFVTELGMTTPVDLPTGGEDFSDTTLEDTARSGGMWGMNGRLVRDIGGGSGRLGELIVTAGSTVVLNTDSQMFPLGNVTNLIGNPDISGNYPNSIEVTDGVFEFSTLIIQPGGTLRFVGSNPARVLVRGLANFTSGSMVDASGASAAPHDSTVLQPEFELGPGPVTAAGAGSGGWGADRWDFDMVLADDSVFIAIGGVDIPEDVAEINFGRDGQGIGGTTLGRGLGGPLAVNFPSEDSLIVEPDTVGVVGAHGSDQPFNRNSQGGFGCKVEEQGTSGSGGAYALAGGDGVSVALVPLADEPSMASNDGPTTAGGAVGPLGLAAPSEANAGYARRTLDWTQGGAYPGFLRGGSGGGGGGLSPLGSSTNTGATSCIPADSTVYNNWLDHSGAKGGDGGGALHLVAGKSLLINGQIDLSGGDGGSALDEPFGPTRFAMPGGGGSGGAFRAQARSVVISPQDDRLIINGGTGGEGFFSPGTVGGDGSVGLVRIEDGLGVILHQVIAPSIEPYLGDGMAPFDDVDKSLDFLSVAPGGFTPSTARPDSICGSTSCWIELPDTDGDGSPDFSVAVFDEDDTTPGWDMDVIWDQSGAEENVGFRSASTAFPNGFEDMFGNLLGPDGGAASPIVVRFQGGRTTTALPDPCGVTVSANNSPVAGLTPWVTHPAELNMFGSNVIRFVILFDNTNNPGAGDTPGVTLANVQGVTNLRIGAAVE